RRHRSRRAGAERAVRYQRGGRGPSPPRVVLRLPTRRTTTAGAVSRGVQTAGLGGRSVLLLLQAALGLRIEAWERRLTLHRAVLPSWLPRPAHRAQRGAA